MPCPAIEATERIERTPSKRTDVLPLERKGLTVSINIMNLDPLKRAVQIMCDVFEDERIPLEIRAEYLDKYNGIEWEADAEQT
ncbi:hypothetical protein [Paenibacillus sp. FSL E2-0177]|uniref:hypothetical protein n=1 Tax=Paenibacillus sp. FSL E2-0177 TaxID=2921360 RepID=UPI0030EE9A5A